MNLEQLRDEYLCKRAITPEAAAGLCWRLLDREGINQNFPDVDGARIEGGILVPSQPPQLICFRPPVHISDPAETGYLRDVDKTLYSDMPENEAFTDAWKVHALGICPEDGYHVYRGRLVFREGEEISRRNYYPLRGAPNMVTAQKLAKAKGISFSVRKMLQGTGTGSIVYVPRPLLGRTLLVVEGATRAAAIVSSGADVDVVSIGGCDAWRKGGDLHPWIKDAVIATHASHKAVVVVLDGDLINNGRVRRAAVKLSAAIAGCGEGVEVRIGVPYVAGDEKAGLDDWLATFAIDGRAKALMGFVASTLPADPDIAIEILRDDKRSNYGDAGAFEGFGRGYRACLVPLAMSAEGSLLAYVRRRRALIEIEKADDDLPGEVSTLPHHPAPEGKLYTTDRRGERGRAGPADIVQVVMDYVAPTLPFIATVDGIGQPTVYRTRDGLCVPASKKAPIPAIKARLRDLMGEEPIQANVDEAFSAWVRSPVKARITPIRRAPSRELAFAELPAAAAGMMPAWEEFLERCSCRNTFLAWLHTLTLPAEQTGRQALFLRGGGNDGKSTIVSLLVTLLGGAQSEAISVISSVTGDDKFAYGALTECTRLLVLDDVRNAALLHFKDVRNLIAGAYMSTERKGRDATVRLLHPRVLIAANMQLKYDIADRAEGSRVLQVDVSETIKAGDSDWPRRLRAEMPQLLAAAEQAYGQLHDGGSITWTAATREVMEGGGNHVEERLGEILTVLELGDGYRMSVRDMLSLMTKHGIKDDKGRGRYDGADLYKHLEARGCFRQARDGVKCWIGVRERGAHHVVRQSLPRVTRAAA